MPTSYEARCFWVVVIMCFRLDVITPSEMRGVLFKSHRVWDDMLKRIGGQKGIRPSAWSSLGPGSPGIRSFVDILFVSVVGCCYPNTHAHKYWIKAYSNHFTRNDRVQASHGGGRSNATSHGFPSPFDLNQSLLFCSSASIPRKYLPYSALFLAPWELDPVLYNKFNIKLTFSYKKG